MTQKLLLLCVAVCLPGCLLADFSYEQSSKMTGGLMMGAMRIAGAFSKQAREPIRTSVAVKGNKMVTGSKDNAQVIDLDSETFTSIDFAKKSYSVMTFAEMTQALENAMQQAQGQKAGTPNDTKSDVKADFKVSVKTTGATKQIGEYNTKEMLMTLAMEGTDQKSGQKGGMLILTSMWMAPRISGYDEISEFYKKMAAKMAWTPGGMGMAAGRADIAKGMAQAFKEAAKLEGVPLLQVMKMQASADGEPVTGQPSGSSAQTSSQQSRLPAEKPSISGALGSLGGFGGFGRKKKQEEPKQETSQAASEPPADTSGTLMEMTTEMSGFSSASVDPSRFAVPAGFKKIENDLQRRAR